MKEAIIISLCDIHKSNITFLGVYTSKKNLSKRLVNLEKNGYIEIDINAPDDRTIAQLSKGLLHTLPNVSSEAIKHFNNHVNYIYLEKVEINAL